MNKINPLQKIQGVPDDRGNDRKVSRRVGEKTKTFTLDRVEISPEARLVQKAESVRKSAEPWLLPDADRLGSQWYSVGYNLPELGDNK